MKSILSVLLVLASLPAIAGDWQRYHHDPAQALELFLDLDSLHQTTEGFESNIRLSLGQGRQEFIGRQTVNCAANTYRLANLQQVHPARPGTEHGDDDSGPIAANSATAELKALYCARWQEPEGVRWQAYAAGADENYFYDARVEKKRGRNGFSDEFEVLLKTMGREKSLLAAVRVSCRENHFRLLSGVYRDEARGWLSNIPAGKAQTPAANSSVAILQSMLCAPADKTTRQPAR